MTGRTHYHRYILFKELTNLGLLNNDNHSWFGSSEEVKECNDTDFPVWLTPPDEEFILHNNILDAEKNEKNQYELPKQFYNCVFNLVSESSYENIFFTEKTYKSILSRKMPIISGAKKTNYALQSMGYKLPTDIIDYSFDLQDNIIDRTNMLCIELQRLNNEGNLQALHEKLLPIADYNMNVAMDKIASLDRVPDCIKNNIDNASRIILSPNSSIEQKMSAQRMIEANQRDLITLENSPLKTFKARVDEILTEKIHAGKLQRFEELKSAIESGRMSTDLSELRNYLIEIDEGIFGFVPDPEKL